MVNSDGRPEFPILQFAPEKAWNWFASPWTGCGEIPFGGTQRAYPRAADNQKTPEIPGINHVHSPAPSLSQAKLILDLLVVNLNLPRTRQGEPPLAQPASEKFNLIELIPMYDGSELLGIRRFLGKINDAAELGGWSNAKKVTILKLELAGIAEEFFLSDPTQSFNRVQRHR
ncbi:hypothetical protein TNCV_4455981 [Trichonephila clavipes]|nr:hypothetical protein TNCV_4455981 [Trichonephila clavipes]